MVSQIAKTNTQKMYVNLEGELIIQSYFVRVSMNGQM